MFLINIVITCFVNLGKES